MDRPDESRKKAATNEREMPTERSLRRDAPERVDLERGTTTPRASWTPPGGEHAENGND